MSFTSGKKRYLKEAIIGEGTFGVVRKALDTQTNLPVAVKKIRRGNRKDGIDMTALREIKLLKELYDPNIINLIDVYSHKGSLHLVLEFMHTDLGSIIYDRNTILTGADIKSYMQMCLKGLAYCHRKWVMHRDLKPNNLLIASNGQLKLSDFGLARIFSSPRRFTHNVFACWYRAPELLFGCKHYGPSADMWAMGCIFAELLLRKPFLPGSSEIDQLGKIFAAFGTPSESQWPGMSSLPDYVKFQDCPPRTMRMLFPMAGDDSLELLSKMFVYNPKARISAEEALKHMYFRTLPVPTRPELLHLSPSKAKISPKEPPTKARRVSLKSSPH